ncbi:hypothetical protein [Solirubrobacter soli]|uniref:hypothetical protein n=1 Tax=Solirubrobacter soli TaxID=363832 RepID=UPI00040D5C38|nr:hypothetical protein [Solirubrobacter soli]
MAALIAVAAIAGCGGDAERLEWPAAKPAFGADTPEHAIQSFIAAAGHPGSSYTTLTEACRQLAPSVRPAVRFNASVAPSESDCAAGLATLLYDTGDTSGIAPPTGFTGTITGTSAAGERATVTIAMSYDGAPGFENRPVRVLVAKEEGSWWVATPRALNVLSAAHPPTDAELVQQYDELVAAAGIAERQAEAGRNAEAKVGGDVRACPRDGASSAKDAHGDVRIADGMRLAPQQVPGHDLVEVIHSGDGDQACFELHFGGDVPSAGAAEIAVLPTGARVAVRWENDRALGQGGTQDAPQAVAVETTRDGSVMTLRLPKTSIGITGGPYRWAAKLFINTASTGMARDTDFDSVPDDLTISGDQDHYIPHAG